QLLAESLGKKYPRKIITTKDGREIWQEDRHKIINVGRTPISCRGTNDLHSVHQNLVGGENNKAVTFIQVKKIKEDFKIPQTSDFISRKSYSELLSLAQEASAWALTREKRPNCTIIMPEVNAYHWGGLIFFFQLATTFEGELLNVNAFDQPGVESYKQYMYYKLKKAGVSKEVATQIDNNPLVRHPRFII
ncbi:MAG: hypothetical protein NC936_06020, partial [Candidatus Omnitrophica bacterium]|nr:hypothetical protein [Candidatus Omnitrophota bacterium]